MGLQLLPVAAAADLITVRRAQVAAVLPPGLGRAPWPRNLRPWREAAGPRWVGEGLLFRASGRILRAADGAEPRRARATDPECRVGGLKTGASWEIGGYGGYGGF